MGNCLHIQIINSHNNIINHTKNDSGVHNANGNLIAFWYSNCNRIIQFPTALVDRIFFCILMTIELLISYVRTT
jgi:hypothetical protein